MDDVQAVEEIFIETTRSNFRVEVSARRGHDSNVDSPIEALGADRTNLAIRQKPSDQVLQRRAQFMYLVEEKCSTAGALEPAASIAMRIGEAALRMPEEERLKNVFADRSASERYERAEPTPAAVMNDAGNRFFSDAVLAGDKYSGI
jgi:hypothetical protein